MRQTAARPARQVPALKPAIALLHWPGDGILWLRGFLGRHLSVRWKLTLWYALAYIATLAVIGLVFPVVLDYQTQVTVDQNLRSTARQLIPQLTNQSRLYGAITLSNQCEAISDYWSVQSYCQEVVDTLDRYSSRLSAPGQFVQVELLVRSDTRPLVPTKSLPPSLAQGIKVSAWDISPAFEHPGTPQFAKLPAPGGEKFRALYMLYTTPPLPNAGPVSGVLEIFQVEHTYIELQHAVVFLLLIGFPIAILLSLVVGWLVARAALRPIARISRKVHAIGESQDLGRRLNFVGPEDEVSRLAHTFDTMMDRLEGVFQQQRRFIGDASHELRTPLTAIRGNADLLSIAPADERELCIASIRREAERMSRLIGDLLLLAETDVAERVVHLRPMDLETVLADVHRSAVLLAGDKLTVRYSPSGPAEIEGDPDRLKQVFLNLVDNAVKFTPKDGVVTLSLRVERGEAVAKVSDTGIGIPQDEQDAIFRRFYRVERSRSTRGSGLGLAICASIVEAHGGTIGVTGKPGQGSTFTVRLPLAHSVAGGNATATRKTTTASAGD